jgi:cytochrome c553
MMTQSVRAQSARGLRLPIGIAWLAVTLVTSAAPVAQQELDAALRAKPQLQHGEKLFEVCAACHASDGGGEGDGGVPAIAGQHTRVILRQLIDFRHGKRWDLRMERIADSHYLAGAQDLADIAAYVASMPRTPNLGTGDGARLDAGTDLYARLCAGCHGSSAQGDGERGIPWLGGQHYQYLLREMYYTVDQRRPNLARDHMRLFARFEGTSFEAVADYLSRLPAQ